jgi:biotin operon repressor
VVFTEDENPSLEKKGVRIGSLAGKGYHIPADFNEPLDNLKECML